MIGSRRLLVGRGKEDEGRRRREGREADGDGLVDVCPLDLNITGFMFKRVESHCAQNLGDVVRFIYFCQQCVVSAIVKDAYTKSLVR